MLIFYQFQGPFMEEEKKIQIIHLFFDYLKNTKPLLLLFHLVYVTLICAIFSTGYVVAFHWTSLIRIYDEAHSIQSFSANLKTSVETDNEIKMALDKLNKQTGGIRAYVYRYHNGLAAISGVPFFFQTMTHEVISPGTSRLMQYEQRIPVGISMNINHAFVENHCAVIPHADADPQHQDYYFFQSRGSRSLIRCPIYMSNGDLFGFIGVDFANDIKDIKDVTKLIEGSAESIGKYFASLKR
jgi:hypothetical protein